ncbi:MAG: type IV pilin N-terminal domain-containing protein [Methanocalculus sp.]|uniref:type IV pilin N-terminal domain-containing protein n=1 Tax=Methanocalculus sp. TaxID=2004547 RepID=UPI002720384A|nr:type IV pilin N-terminal domain-containing protein [Methanocalculus sp.]MDO9539825.1 type IV pilin N-terminal domain-containing protein [Methanocalculus sp.]
MTGRDTAVSPVVGVMLMLAITVMIAAIVSAAAGGLSGTEKKAPSAILDITIYASKDYSGYSLPSLIIKHISGNVLATKDLQIILYYRTPSGTIVKGNLSGQYAVSGVWSIYNSGKYCGVLFINDENRFGSDTLQDSAKGYANWFGNASATFRPGDILVTPAQYCGPELPHHNTGMDYLFPGVDLKVPAEFPVGSVVTVKIIHTPSGQIIYDKDVVIV